MRQDGSRTQETIEHFADDVKDRVEYVTDQARQELSEVQAQVREFRREMVQKAMAVKDKAAEELVSAAQRIRREAKESKDPETVGRAARIARRLEQSASFLDKQALENAGQDVVHVARQNAWQILGVAFALGVVIGLLVALSRRR
jgi:ElaB/YqjD/DUF883 family membrane-anchored ribosome-binding protein